MTIFLLFSFYVVGLVVGIFVGMLRREEQYREEQYRKEQSWRLNEILARDIQPGLYYLTAKRTVHD